MTQTTVKLNMPREIEHEIGQDVIKDFGESLTTARAAIVEKFAGAEGLSSETLNSIVEHGQHSVLSLIDQDSGKLVFNAGGDADEDDVITVELKGNLAQTFFAKINS